MPESLERITIKDTYSCYQCGGDTHARWICSCGCQNAYLGDWTGESVEDFCQGEPFTNAGCRKHVMLVSEEDERRYVEL